MRVRRNQSKDTPCRPTSPSALHRGAHRLPARGGCATADPPRDRDGRGGVVERSSAARPCRRFTPSVTSPSDGCGPRRRLPPRRGAPIRQGPADPVPASPPTTSASLPSTANTPKLPEGMLVPPGRYRVALTVAGREYVKPLVEADPALASRATSSPTRWHSRATSWPRSAPKPSRGRAARRPQARCGEGEHEDRGDRGLEARIAPLNAPDDDQAPNIERSAASCRATDRSRGSDRPPTRRSGTRSLTQRS
jgi:hypothetical protein